MFHVWGHVQKCCCSGEEIHVEKRTLATTRNVQAFIVHGNSEAAPPYNSWGAPEVLRMMQGCAVQCCTESDALHPCQQHTVQAPHDAGADRAQYFTHITTQYRTVLYRVTTVQYSTLLGSSADVADDAGLQLWQAPEGGGHLPQPAALGDLRAVSPLSCPREGEAVMRRHPEASARRRFERQPREGSNM